MGALKFSLPYPTLPYPALPCPTDALNFTLNFTDSFEDISSSHIPSSLQRLLEAPLPARGMWAVDSIQVPTHPTASPTPEDSSLQSIAVVMAGDVRTLLCRGTQEKYRDYFDSFSRIGFKVHLFAYLSREVFYGVKSPWAHKSKCEGFNVSSPMLSRALSTVPLASVEAAVEAMGVKYTLEVVETLPNPRSTSPDADWGCYKSAYGKVNNLERLVGQWANVFNSYLLVMGYETKLSTTFDYVLRVRPDVRVGGIRINTSVPLKDQYIFKQLASTPVFKYGDGQAIMTRQVSDIYFTTYRTYLHYCPSIKALRKKLNSWIDDISWQHLARYNVTSNAKTDSHFYFVYVRPHNCTHICAT